MDPDETLRLYKAALRAGEEEYVYEYAEHLVRWLDRGGFKPRGFGPATEKQVRYYAGARKEDAPGHTRKGEARGRKGRSGGATGHATGISYQTNDPRGWGGDPSRGAALGRPTLRGDASYAGRLSLRQVRLDRGGYDSNGTYFGIGRRLFWLASEDGTIDKMMRASSREDAKAEARAAYPHAKFFR